MSNVAEPISRLIEEFSRLPGIGPKTASRLTYFLLRAPDERVVALGDAIRELKERLVYCQVCQNIGEQSPCSICTDERRDRSVICVVEEPLDVLAIEKTGHYDGLYHVLHGAISPVDGIGPDEIRIRELLARLRDGTVREVLLGDEPQPGGRGDRDVPRSGRGRIRAPPDPPGHRLAHRRRPGVRGRDYPRPRAGRAPRAMSGQDGILREKQDTEPIRANPGRAEGCQDSSGRDRGDRHCSGYREPALVGARQSRPRGIWDLPSDS